VEGLPLRLIIVAIVMGISIPSVLALWSNVEKQQTENAVRAELNYLMLRIGQVHRSGPGNAISVELNLRSGMMSSIEYVLVGDDLDSPWRSAIRWKLNGQGEELIAIENDVPVCSNSGVAFQLSEGHNLLYLETKKKENGLVFVEISALD
jgi:hypothetical protein